MGENVTPREWAKMALYYSQEISLDVATAGKEAADRAVRNAKLLKDATELWVTYCGWKPHDLMKEIWDHDPDAKRREQERKTKATGRRTRA
jgi:hypothetical protein